MKGDGDLMVKNCYSFDIGEFECLAVSDGTFNYQNPAELLFPDVSKVELKRICKEHDIRLEKWKNWLSDYICLVINTGDELILIDTGAGKDDISSPETGLLLDNLETEGFLPSDFDRVIISHVHPDHIGGVTSKDNRLVFTDSEFILWKDEWDFWTSSRVEDELKGYFKHELIECARNNLPPIKHRVNLIDQEMEIVPGLKIFEAKGHTPGQIAISVSTDDDELIYFSDSFIHPIHVERPDWYTAIDLNPEQAVKTRCNILNQASNGETLLFGFHFPFPGLGYLKKKENRFFWSSI